MLSLFSRRYRKVEQVDELPNTPGIPKKGSVLKTIHLPWLLHLIVLATYSVILFVTQLNRNTWSPCFNEFLLGAPIVWEERTFTTNRYVKNADSYSIDNPDVDSVWADPIEHTIIVITEREKQKLPGGRDTARAYGAQGGYAVSIEMFHQLHCLNYLRKAFFYEANDRAADSEKHSDHCFSYLYQSLLCYADVEVMTMRVDENFNIYQPEFNVTKQCRDYNIIKAWQETRKAEYQNPP
ncbi:oxidase ustYa family protein [Aspergillus ibericus CBS 121593]|uniref:Tat pathway signal sequence n=1 Tax=Aspergillus ibericus CBS 121593 TaxID=1448316 RepID=A0A395GY65_9EURO|nr:hypothetical protein BO80DRAFT_112452 [Aspergillus ibericus CBS 121593]RAL00025.1 hypothetical protein BO80DRAFT_112452 [Aspergillus ibericus CBS 121593]